MAKPTDQVISCRLLIQAGTAGRFFYGWEMKMNGELTGEEQKSLLALARKALEQYVLSKDIIKIAAEAKLSLRLQEKAACFVTLKIGESLRGCIGSIYAELPLYQEVIRRTTDAAAHDPRFAQVQSAEVERICITISVLSPLQAIDSYQEFIPRKHGIILSKENHRAVYLPQVAEEQGWSREQTLKHLALKAGLPADAWKAGCQFQVFSAQIFSENKHSFMDT